MTETNRYEKWLDYNPYSELVKQGIVPKDKV